MSLRDDGVSGRKCRCRITSGNAKREGEVTRPEHRNGAKRHEEPAHVWTGPQGSLSGVIDGNFEKASFADGFRKQPELKDGPRQLAVQTDICETRLCHCRLYECLTVSFKSGGNRVE
jgi:hypothetical protein